MDLDFVVRVLSLYDGEDGNNIDDVWWRTDGEYAPITFFVLCNDLFYWASADGETITRDNIDLLEQTLNEVKSVNPDYRFQNYGSLLFCCRVRKMRPQGAYYESIPQDLWTLFDACGEQRPAQFGNPQNRPSQEPHDDE